MTHSRGARPERDLSREIDEALEDRGLREALRKATARANAHRREAVDRLDDYPETRRRAREIKERAIDELPELLERFEASVEAAGGRVHRAENAAEARRIVVEIARAHGVERAVKSKSMTTEEIDLNEALQKAGIRVRETDLGEYVVQIADDRPSHIVAPIIHMGLDEVRAAFRDGLGLESVPERAEGLTALARRILRREFLEADLGITGANFLLADSGTVVLVENEGNARLTTEMPPVHVVVAGIEKVIPGVRELLPFFRLLPRSATGQLQTSYVSLISPPGSASQDESESTMGPASGFASESRSAGSASRRELHIVLVDNGRTAMRDDPDLREALYCIRCGACLNACPPYQVVGGHVYGGDTYQSGIGNAWEAGVSGAEAAAGFNRLCTTCSRCHDVCPVEIDIPWMNAVLRDRLARGEDPVSPASSTAPSTISATADSTERSSFRSRLAVRFFSDPARVYRWGRATEPLSGWLLRRAPVRRALERLVGLDRRRPLPRPAPETLSDWYAVRGGLVVDDPASARELANQPGSGDTVALLVDCHTENLEVEVGKEAVRVLEALGVRPALVVGGCCGRAAFSQGAMDTARDQAGRLGATLAPLASAGLEIVGIEPSCLTAVAADHGKLRPDDPEEERIAGRCRDLMEFLVGRADEIRRRIEESGSEEGGGHGARREREDPGRTGKRRSTLVVVHGHCQQKTAGWLPATVELLSSLPGCRVETTSAECCGMAGSFGYKREFYGLSVELGRRLLLEMRRLGSEAGVRERVVHVAAGTSCRAQLRDLGDMTPRHPVELLGRWLGPVAKGGGPLRAARDPGHP